MFYLNLSEKGENTWWRYLLGILVILFMWMGIGAIPMLILGYWVKADQNKQTYFDSDLILFQGIDPALNFSVLMLASVPLLLGIFLVVHFLHKRPFMTLITTLHKVNWKQYLWSGFTMLLILGSTTLIDSLLSPDDYRYVLQWKVFLPFLFLALILVPIQASAEELLFRGYLMQAFGRIVKTPWIVAGLSSIVFMMPHLFNPEAETSLGLAIASYTLVGLFLAMITLKSNSLELAMGAHTGMNLFNCFIGSSADQVFSNIPTIFVRYENSVINGKSLLSMIMVFLVFYILTSRKYRYFTQRNQDN